MDITLFVTDNCSSCQRVESQLKKLLKDRKDVNLHIDDIKTVASRGIIVAPAVFIDKDLYSYGDLDEHKFIRQLNLHVQTSKRG